MARLIQAIAKYGPRVERGRTAQLDEVAKEMARGGSLHEFGIRSVLTALPEALVWFNQQGRAVKLTGIGTFGTTVDRNGRIGVSYYQDPGLRAQLNSQLARSKHIRNRRNIGLDDAGYIALWNAEHPDDPVV